MEYKFRSVINFKYQVPHSLSLKPLFPLAPGQRPFDLVRFHSRVIRQTFLVCDLFPGSELGERSLTEFFPCL